MNCGEAVVLPPGDKQQACHFGGAATALRGLGSHSLTWGTWAEDRFPLALRLQAREEGLREAQLLRPSDRKRERREREGGAVFRAVILNTSFTVEEEQKKQDKTLVSGPSATTPPARARSLAAHLPPRSEVGGAMARPGTNSALLWRTPRAPEAPRGRV